MELAEYADDAPASLEAVVYIAAMLKPLLDVAKSRRLTVLSYFIEMAVLYARDLELRLKARQLEMRATPPDQDDAE